MRTQSQGLAALGLLVAAPGTGGSITNVVDVGAATNSTARCYRVRLGP